MTPRPEHNMDTASSRTCPFCAESIKREAKVCPRCRQWLTLRSIRNPAITVWIYGLPHLAIYALIGMLILTALNRFQNPKPDYTAFVNSLRVMESRLNWAETSSGLRIYVTGILTNQSEFAWRDIELECRFFDANGHLVDAAHPHAGLTIQPHDDTAFRAVVTPSHASNDYASFRISVSTARNTKSLF
jgi:predicted nucleic acid-binding Zn ribbon protein